MLQKTNKIISDYGKYFSLNELYEKDGFKAVTNNVEVAVWPEFSTESSDLLTQMNIWNYSVKITNKNDRAIKLRSRYFKIIDEDGNIEEVTGDGVIGKQPEILPNNSFEYQSSVNLKSASAIMSGYYVMEFIDGEGFDAQIPKFSLDLPVDNYLVN